MIRVAAALPEPDFCLLLHFTNGEKRRFDVRPYLDKGVFRRLQDYEAFRQVKVVRGTVEWPDEIDLCPDSLYENSELIQDPAST